MLSTSVESVLEKFGAGGLAPGDIVVTNDPYERRRLAPLRRVRSSRRSSTTDELVAFAVVEGALDGGRRQGPRLVDDRLDRDLPGGAPVPLRQDLEPRRARTSAGRHDRRERAHCRSMTLGDLMAQAAAMRVGERALPRGLRQVRRSTWCWSRSRRCSTTASERRDSSSAKLPNGRLRGRGLRSTTTASATGRSGARQGHDHRRRVRLRLHRLAPAGPGPGEQAPPPACSRRAQAASRR